MGRINKAVAAVAGLLGVGDADIPTEARAPSAGLRWHPQSDSWFEKKLRQRLDPDDRVGYRTREAAEAKRARKRARNKAYGLGGWRIA